MALQVLSDLHLEAPKGYEFFDILPKAPYLALLGDVGNIVPHRDDFIAFITQQLKQFQVVLFVLGNHEAYHSNWYEALSILRGFENDARNDAALGEFVLLDRAAYRLPGTNTVILGCSLFSYIPPESEQAVSFGLNDFYQIDGWDVTAHNEAHRRDLAWLNTNVARLEREDVKIVILSHWSPSTDSRSIDPKHATSPITSAFATDLSDQACFESEKVKIWAFGHTHYNCDFSFGRKGGTGPLRLVTNQRGYYFSQAKGFDAEKVIEV